MYPKLFKGTVTSLRERLKQKEETLERYENMLKQIRRDNEEELKLRQDEIVALQGGINHVVKKYSLQD